MSLEILVVSAFFNLRRYIYAPFTPENYYMEP